MTQLKNIVVIMRMVLPAIMVMTVVKVLPAVVALILANIVVMT